MNSRRSFVRNTGFLGLFIPFVKEHFITGFGTGSLPAIGIQLYMVRDDMKKDAAGTLKKLGGMGYSQIESFGGDPPFPDFAICVM